MKFVHGAVAASKRGGLLLMALLTGLFVSGPAQAQPARKPNIIFVLLDNLGWGELGSYGGGSLRGAPTPRMDKLAEEGLRLTKFNVEASCTPTRSALMTGRFSVRSGNLRSGASGLVRWELTIAQLLKRQGYATAAFGKWHLGDEQGRYPNDFGFDQWYGIPRTSGESMNRLSPGYSTDVREPMYIMEGVAGGRARNVKEYDMENRREIDGEIIDKTIGFVSQNAKAGTPFYAYVPMTQVHYPTVPGRAFAGKSGFGDFADSMLQTDHLIGKLVDAVEAAGLGEDTLLIIASDNGPEYRRPWRGTAGPWSGTYHTMMEGGLRAPCIVRWTGRIKPAVSDGMVHAVDMFSTLARVGGAPVPNDRPIDGIDQFDFFVDAGTRSKRDGFPIYIEGDQFGAKYRDWKYHILWKPDPEKPIERPAKPYLFNITVDPKEETPRALLEDSWVREPITAMLAAFEKSLADYPSVPFGAPLGYTPSLAASAKQTGARR
jgi:arylsulfatase